MTQKEIDAFVLEIHKPTTDNSFIDFNFEIQTHDIYVVLLIFKGNSLVTYFLCESETHAQIIKDNIIKILSYDRLSDSYFERG